MFEPTPDNPTFIEMPVELHQVKQPRKFRTPTEHALLLGNLYADAGYKLSFDIKLNNVDVDIFFKKSGL